MPKIELTKEQLTTLREAFIFGVEDRAANGLDEDDKAIVAAIDQALVDPRILAARGALGSLPPSDRLLVINSYCLVCGFSLEDGKCLAEHFGIGSVVIDESELGPSASPEVMAERQQKAEAALKRLANTALNRFHGIDRTKDGGTGGGVKERSVLLLTPGERELLIAVLRAATYEAQQDFDSANSKTELIGNREVLDECQKIVTDTRALLVRVQNLIGRPAGQPEPQCASCGGVLYSCDAGIGCKEKKL